MFERSIGVLLILATSSISLAQSGPRPNDRYELRVAEDKVSLKADQGRLVHIIEDLGGLLGFEVIAGSVGEIPVTLEFENLPASEAIRRICQSVGYIEVPDLESGKIARLVLTSQNSGANRLAPRRDPLPTRPKTIEPRTAAKPAKNRAAQAEQQKQKQKQKQKDDKKDN